MMFDTSRRVRRRTGGWAMAGWLVGAVLAVGAYAEESTALFLWELRSPTSTSFLLGSLHAAYDDLYPLPEAMETSFAASDTLVVEVDVGARPESEMAALLLSRAVEPGAPALSDLLDEPSRRRLDQVLASHGLSVARLDRFRPWYVAMMVTVLEMKRLGMDVEKGIDRYFLSQARDEKPILELEGIKQQIALFSGLSQREQMLLLRNTLRDLQQFGTLLDDITSAWQNGETEVLDQLLNGYVRSSPGLEELFRKVFAERNHRMAAKILDYLKTDRSYFIVVGAGHLVGREGLVQILSTRGIAVHQLRREPALARD